MFEREGDDFRELALRNSMPLSDVVDDLSPGQRERLCDVVKSAWPDEGARAHVHREENNVRFGDLGAYAWLTLAPALDLRPSDEQWADLATSGAVWTDTADWLRRHYTAEAAAKAAEMLDSDDSAPWGQLLSAIPSDQEVPDAVIDAMVDRVRTVDNPHGGLWNIGQRLGGAGNLGALQAISSRSDALESGLRVWRARLGETEAASSLLGDLTGAVKEGKGREWDDPEWLEGVSDPVLLPDLFEALRADLMVERDDPFGPSRYLHRAILRIGGDDAVKGYDELMSTSDESRFNFLRIHRDDVVQAELRKIGQESAADVARTLGLPVLDAN